MVGNESHTDELRSIGRTIGGRYRITGWLGGGGMANVYRGEDLILERPVAIKMLHRRFTSDANGIERFRREGIMLASVECPNVVGIYDIGMDGGNAYLVMQYIQGRTLEQVIAREGAMDAVRAGDILVQLLDGLATLQASGLVHRDIKPSNVMIDPTERAVLLDLGIGLDPRRSRLTDPGAIPGTPAYLPPERQSGVADTRSDMYQIALLMILMLTGVDPGTVPPSSIDTLLDMMPRGLARVARCALSSPQLRYENVAEMVRAVAAARDVREAAAPADDMLDEPPTREMDQGLVRLLTAPKDEIAKNPFETDVLDHHTDVRAPEMLNVSLPLPSVPTEMPMGSRPRPSPLFARGSQARVSSVAHDSTVDAFDDQRFDRHVGLPFQQEYRTDTSGLGYQEPDECESSSPSPSYSRPVLVIERRQSHRRLHRRRQS